MGPVNLQSQRWPLQSRMHCHAKEYEFSFHLKLDCPLHEIFLLCLVLPVYSPGVCCTSTKPGLWPLGSTKFFVAQCEKWWQCLWNWVPCSRACSLHCTPLPYARTPPSTTAARFCFLCQQITAIHPWFSTVWLEVRTTALLVKVLDWNIVLGKAEMHLPTYRVGYFILSQSEYISPIIHLFPSVFPLSSPSPLSLSFFLHCHLLTTVFGQAFSILQGKWPLLSRLC